MSTTMAKTVEDSEEEQSSFSGDDASFASSDRPDPDDDDDDESYGAPSKTKKRKATKSPPKKVAVKKAKKPAKVKVAAKKTTASKSKTKGGGKAKDGASKGSPKDNILSGLLELAQFGMHDASRVYTALFAGYKNVRSDGFIKALKLLAEEDKIEYPAKDAVRITEKGKDSVPSVPPTKDNAEALDRLKQLVKMVCGKKGPKSDLICEFLSDGQEHSLKSLANHCGYTNVRSEGLTSVLTTLTNLKLIERDSGTFMLADIAFPHGRPGAATTSSDMDST